MLRQIRGLACVLALCGAVGATKVSNETAQADSVTLYPTNPSIDYRPAYYCVDFRYRNCYGWKYAWELAVYEDPRTGLNRSVAFVTDEHDRNTRDEVREISLAIPKAREVHIYAAPRAWTRKPNLSMASLDLCIEHWERPCIRLDVQDTYSQVIDEHEPVLVWSGRLPDRIQQEALTLTMRMAEPLDSVGGQSKLMTLDSVVCYGLAKPLAQRPYPAPPANLELREMVVDDLDGAITYRPGNRWNTTAKVGHGGIFSTVTQASTIYGANERTPMPEFSLEFAGSTDITIWSAPPAAMGHLPGGVRVCVDLTCEIVDVFQLYLNPSSTPPSTSGEPPHNSSAGFYGESEGAISDVNNSPVAIWSASGLDFRRVHRLSVMLIESNPQLGKDGVDRLRALALDYVTYTKVLGAEPEPSRPIPFIMLAMMVAGAAIAATALVQYNKRKMRLEQKPPSEHTPINPQHVPGGYYSSYTSPSSSTTPPAYTPGRR